jgi:hypothetical protein
MADKALIVVHTGQIVRAYCSPECRDAEENRLIDEREKQRQ